MKYQLNVIKWLGGLADEKPLIFSITILLIAISVMAVVIVNRDNKIDACDQEKKEVIRACELRIDSLNRVYKTEIAVVNLELKESFLSIIEDSRKALEEQKALNQKINTTIVRTSKLIKKTRSRIKNLRQ